MIGVTAALAPEGVLLRAVGLFGVTAVVAPLAGVGGIHRHHSLASAFGLLLQHGAEGGPASIGDTASQRTLGATAVGQPTSLGFIEHRLRRPQHSGHVQIFDGEEVVIAHQATRQLVQTIGSLVRHPGVQPGDLQPAPVIAMASCLPAPCHRIGAGAGSIPPSKAPLQTPQSLAGCVEVLWRGHLFAIGGDGEGCQAQVNAHAAPVLWADGATGGAFHFHHEAGEVAATAIADHRAGAGLRR